jgi:hypothetical protein
MLSEFAPENSLKKIVLERNNVWAAVFQLLGALNLPPSPSALFCPASALPARGFFLRLMFMVCFNPRLAGAGRADVWTAAPRAP